MPPLENNEGNTPESSAGAGSEAEQGYLNDFQGEQQAGESPTPGDDKSPDTSTGEAGEANTEAKPKSSMDVVDAAMKGLSEDGKSPHPEGEDQKAEGAEDEKSEEAKAEGEEGDEKDADGNKLPPFHNHPRWKEMVQQRDQLKQELEAVKPDLELAESYKKVNNFLAENNLSGQDFQNALHIGALMRNDPEKALQALQPYYEALMQNTGRILPQDLQQAVDNGSIDEQTAYRYSAERARRSHLEQQNQQLTERQRAEQERRQQIEAQQRQQAQLRPMYDAVAQWEQQWKANDPDHEKLAPMVRMKVQELMQQEKPSGPEQAVKLAERAVKEARDYVKQFQPAAQPKNKQPLPDGANTGQQPRQQPKNSLDVVNQALSQ